MFQKILVANRGEIAIRAIRAAQELGAQTVAVFPYEDRGSEHRVRADEAYEIGERGHPVRAYLDPEAIVGAAVSAGADAIYPGYGFLSENPDLAEACERAGITFIGPPRQVLELTGNKASAIAAAKAAGVPTLNSVEPSADVDELMSASDKLTYPLFVKAVAGGGGRGMRRVDDPAKLRESIEAAMREADGAFGDPTCFIEEAVVDARHIEVQILADQRGNVVHLRERDCSVQRRHQKVVEIAPAPNLDRATRKAMCADAVKFAESINYSCAGTVEFLLGADGRYVFIEMNPRIQVEHTVTEEVTNVDLVQAQMRIAAGDTLADLGLDDQYDDQGARLRAAVPHHDRGPGQRLPPRHRHDHVLPLAGRPGRTPRRRHDLHRRRRQRALRLDAVQADVPRPRLRGSGDPRRARAERVPIGGVSTNIPFLKGLLANPDFRAGHVTTTFIEGHPELLRRTARPIRPARSCPGSRTSRSTSPTALRRPRSTRAPSCPRSTCRSRRLTDRASCSCSSDPRDSPRHCGSATPSASPTRRSATRTSRCWRPAYVRATS